MTLNRDLFYRDPTTFVIPNDGVSEVGTPETSEQWNVLRYEVEVFVCEGEYQDGLDRICVPTWPIWARTNSRLCGSAASMVVASPTSYAYSKHFGEISNSRTVHIQGAWYSLAVHCAANLKH